jgi:hypothetical protein
MDLEVTIESFPSTLYACTLLLWWIDTDAAWERPRYHMSPCPVRTRKNLAASSYLVYVHVRVIKNVSILDTTSTSAEFRYREPQNVFVRHTEGSLPDVPDWTHANHWLPSPHSALGCSLFPITADITLHYLSRATNNLMSNTLFFICRCANAAIVT